MASFLTCGESCQGEPPNERHRPALPIRARCSALVIVLALARRSVHSALMALDPLARQSVRSVLARFGILSARRAVDTDSSEEVILVQSDVIASVDASQVALAIMDVLPHTKVWVVEANPAWDAEPL